jgi:hypothetical protein
LTVAVLADRTAAAGTGTVVVDGADLTALTAAEVGCGVIASSTTGRVAVRADGTS